MCVYIYIWSTKNYKPKASILTIYIYIYNRKLYIYTYNIYIYICKPEKHPDPAGLLPALGAPAGTCVQDVQEVLGASSV